MRWSTKLDWCGPNVNVILRKWIAEDAGDSIAAMGDKRNSRWAKTECGLWSTTDGV
jgi:hypothetical protein